MAATTVWLALTHAGKKSSSARAYASSHRDLPDSDRSRTGYVAPELGPSGLTMGAAIWTLRPPARSEVVSVGCWR